MYNPDNYLDPVLETLFVCYQIAFCFPVLIFPMLLVDIQRTYLMAQSSRGRDIYFFSPFPLLFDSNHLRIWHLKYFFNLRFILDTKQNCLFLLCHISTMICLPRNFCLMPLNHATRYAYFSICCATYQR